MHGASLLADLEAAAYSPRGERAGSGVPHRALPASEFARKELHMARELRCADLGMKCDWSVKAETDEEVLRKAAAHAAQEHHLARIEEPMLSSVKRAIHAA